MVENPTDSRDMGLIPGWGRSPGGGNSNPLQYSCLGNPMDRGAWWTTVHRVAKSWTDMTEQLNLHLLIYIHISNIFIIYMRYTRYHNLQDSRAPIFVYFN